ncbi:focadhesin-like isoform X2 [Liolophura sinensis]|uniref:focadhesin-like isoform X2 n=1 Tax=Liolophura sinensis TaxID=3198878 RepID=UPI00315911DB
MLPPHIIADFVKEATTQAEKKDDSNVTVDSLYPSVPPVCYIRLLTSLQSAVLNDFSAFLTSVVSREINNLPRGIYNSARIRGVTSNQNKALTAIPAFLAIQYEKCKQPGLRPALAASQLFCFDAPLEVGRGGRPRQRHFMDRRKKFLAQLSALLQEVPIQPSEWHRSMSLPRGWSTFMDRVYTAVVQGREAEIELQARHEQLHPDDALEKKKSAWLWARDLLVDSIRGASRGNPTCQANCVFALAGLTATVNNYSTGLDPEDLKNVSHEHMSHSHWLAVVMDTLMSLMDVKFQPSGQLLGMCQQRGVIDRQEASVLARSAASVAIAQVIPAVMTFDTDRIYKMIDMLKAGLPGRAPGSLSGVLQSYSGLGLGMLLARLFEEHFTDVGGTKGMTEVWKALDVLEQCCLQSTADHRQGSMLGLGVALGSLCADGRTDSRVHVLSLHDKLSAMLDSLSTNEDTFQTCCVSLATLSSSAFSANILSSDNVTKVLEKLTSLSGKHSKNAGLCLSVGMLGYSLAVNGHPAAASGNEQRALEWQKQLSAEDVSSLQKVAVLTGLTALCGSERFWTQVSSSGASEVKDTYSADVISMCRQIVESHGDLGIQGAGAWLLGHLHLSACNVTETRTSAPSSFSYLPDTSVIRAVVDFLLEAGKQGPDVIPSKLVEICLSSLLENVKQVLPPVNWTGLLSPLMRWNFGGNVACLCLRLAISQSIASSAAALFVTTWLAQSLFNSLHLIKSISPSILKKFLVRPCAEQFTASPPKGENCQVILQGLLGALQVPDPPEAVTSLLYEATELFYSILPKTLQLGMYSLMCDCLAELPDERFDLIVVEDFTDPANHIRGTYVRCHLVAKGKQPVALLNGCIDATMNIPQCDKCTVLSMLAQCFYQTSLTTVQMTSAIPRLQWLLELMGHTKNIAVEALPLRVENSDQALPQAVEFGLQCVAAAICLWTSPVFGGVVGVQSGWFSSPSPGVQSDVECVNYDPSLPYFPALLPAYIERFNRAPWDQILGKVLDWLWVFSQLPDQKLSPESKQHCVAAMLALRHTQDFRKNVTWTKVLVQTKGDTKTDLF